ncbi:MAG: GlsB/YeaQ/YmgE family stress response membrane protein [Bauldia sp.]|nr:GlsB/YeaQ/YmgE family stress response membrane protein [Bauldia sp.]
MFGMEGVGFFGSIVIGLVAGYVAERVTESRHGLITNLVVGVIGALVGGFLGGLINLDPPVGFWRNLAVATIGAIIFLWVWQVVRGRRT